MDYIKDINKLIKLEIGDNGRLNHIKESLESNKPLFNSDRNYLLLLIDKNLYSRAENIISESCLVCGKKLINNTCKHCNSIRNISRPTKYKNENTTLILAVVLGVLAIQGVGYMYIGKTGKGIGFLLGSIFVFVIGLVLTVIHDMGFLLIILYTVMFIYQITDSRKLCRYYNEYIEKNNKKPW